ncbi:sigma 54-interacting transcriptional regulator [Candidatus Poribacteria bacterium]|nr:sigma 54-interacting transcriptional regulator [Candidatus Poribacteria bacterium]MBT5536275.1 sigma 54-interacting transcriptional regulator [Candidatus Poribacteria bacterium]MBT7100712.1 sigma 54-interacting transcriptional regulator [Candidatus Poribacteria bacterium]MBT7806605.1 sigma 54-interacting transcriptional regulator [Candidatus Poribacteria bacterium]
MSALPLDRLPAPYDNSCLYTRAHISATRPRAVKVATTVNLPDEAVQASKVLIVDDDEATIESLGAALAEKGYECIRSVTDPTAAAGVYAEYRPDIVLLDRDMPGMDGFAVMDALEDLENGSYLPVLMMIDDEDASPRIRALASPAKDIITKPIDVDELCVRMGNLLEVRLLYGRLALKEHTLESVLDYTGEAIAMFDAGDRLEFANRQYQELFRLDDAVLPGMAAADLRERTKDTFHEPDRFEAADRSVFADTSAVLEDIVETAMPAQRLLYRFSAPVLDRARARLGRIVVYRDVSKDAEIEEMKGEVLRLRAELRAEYGFDSLIGDSRAMREMFALMHSALGNDITVLVQGESGTGKELVARAIHVNSARRGGPFVAVNCAAIPETLIESELFGHERGAFTGATARRIGQFEQADGGTVLLDEIGEMNPMAQAKLLRVLQEREIQRVGGAGVIPVDVRVIAATHKDLPAAVEAGAFRDDLYYRIAVYPIPVPPLRDRSEDIPTLTDHMVRKYAASLNKPVRGVSVGALQQLMDYDWPGNVRELENVVQRGVVLTPNDLLSAEALPAHLRPQHPLAGDDDDVLHAPSAPQSPDAQPGVSLSDTEKAAIERALAVTGNNVKQAANLLKVNRTTLYRKMKRHGLAPDR